MLDAIVDEELWQRRGTCLTNGRYASLCTCLYTRAYTCLHTRLYTRVDGSALGPTDRPTRPSSLNPWILVDILISILMDILMDILTDILIDMLIDI